MLKLERAEQFSFCLPECLLETDRALLPLWIFSVPCMSILGVAVAELRLSRNTKPSTQS